MPDFISKYFWLVFIIVTCTQATYFKHRSQNYIDADPSLAEGYSKLFKGYIFWMNIPWVVMGIGCTIGGVPSMFHYFNPQDGNPYVLAWYGTVFLLWISGSFWLFFMKGAETLVKHPGLVQVYSPLRRTDITNPWVIKLLWLVCLLGGISGVYKMWTQKTLMP